MTIRKRMWDAWEWTKKVLLLLLPFKNLLCLLTTLASKWLAGHKSQSGSGDGGPRHFSEIPGPKPSLPIIGTTWTYWFGQYQLNKLHKANVDKYRSFGNIMKEEFVFNVPLVQIFDPKDMEKVLKQQGKCPIRPANEAMAKYRRENPDCYNNVGLVNAQGEEWFQLRAKLNPILMKQKTIHQYLAPMDDILEDFASFIRTTRDTRDQISDAISQLYKLALETVLYVCLEQRFGCLDPDLKPDSEAHQMIRASYDLFEAYQHLYFGPPFWKYFRTAAYEKMARSETTTHKIASKYVEQAIEQARELRESGCLDENECGLTILSQMIAHDDIDFKDIRTSVVDFIVAGIDTVATTVLFVLYQLAMNPDVQEQLRMEIDRIVPRGTTITSRALANMPYLKACVKETFRLSPTIPNMVRILPDDIVLQNYLIPAGTPICCHSMVASQLDENFPDPESFMPERWLEQGENSHPCCTLPFGSGARMCIGHKLAEQEIYVITTKILQHFRIECDEKSLECIYRFIIVPEKPVPLRFIDR